MPKDFFYFILTAFVLTVVLLIRNELTYRWFRRAATAIAADNDRRVAVARASPDFNPYTTLVCVWDMGKILRLDARGGYIALVLNPFVWTYNQAFGIKLAALGIPDQKP